MLLIAASFTATAQTTTEMVSQNSEGYSGNSLSTRPSLSNLGKYVFFGSYANDLYPNDTNGQKDVFVLLPAGVIGLASVGPSYVQGNYDSYDGVTVADGTTIAFASAATNLVEGDTNQQTDVFVRGPTPNTVRVSIGPGGAQGNGISYDPSISADGRYVAFSSYADNFVASDTNEVIDVFVHDRQTGVTRGISNNGYIGQGNGASYGPAISGNGRFIAFTTFANNYLWSGNTLLSQKNLTPLDTNNSPDVYVYDQLADTIERVSVNSEGVEGNSWSHHAAISEDGRYIAFSSSASNLVPDDSNGLTDFFVHDRDTGKTQRVGEDASRHSEGNRNYRNVSITLDGRYIAFSSNSNSLVPDDTNQESDIFVYDRATDVIERVSLTDDGNESFGDSAFPSLSPEGRDVGFASDAIDLDPAPDDTNDTDDIFVRRSWQTVVIFANDFEGGNFEHWSSIVGFSESCLRHHDSSADDYLFVLTMVPVEDGGFLGKFSPVSFPFEPTTVEIGFTQATGTAAGLISMWSSMMMTVQVAPRDVSRVGSIFGCLHSTDASHSYFENQRLRSHPGSLFWQYLRWRTMELVRVTSGGCRHRYNSQHTTAGELLYDERGLELDRRHTTGISFVLYPLVWSIEPHTTLRYSLNPPLLDEPDQRQSAFFPWPIARFQIVPELCHSDTPSALFIMAQHGYPLSSGSSESGRNWRMNDGPVGDGSYGDDLLNQSSGDPPDAAGLAPVETKRVLVQVSSEVLTACASVIGPE